jgi:hypothetical protein
MHEQVHQTIRFSSMVLHKHFQRERRTLPPAVELLGAPPQSIAFPPPQRLAITGPDQAAVLAWTLADNPSEATVQLAAVPAHGRRPLYLYDQQKWPLLVGADILAQLGSPPPDPETGWVRLGGAILSFHDPEPTEFRKGAWGGRKSKWNLTNREHIKSLAAFWFAEVYGSYSLPALAIWDLSRGTPLVGTGCNRPAAHRDNLDERRLCLRMHGQTPGHPPFVNYTRAQHDLFVPITVTPEPQPPPQQLAAAPGLQAAGTPLPPADRRAELPGSAGSINPPNHLTAPPAASTAPAPPASTTSSRSAFTIVDPNDCLPFADAVVVGSRGSGGSSRSSIPSFPEEPLMDPTSPEYPQPENVVCSLTGGHSNTPAAEEDFSDNEDLERHLLHRCRRRNSA